MLNDLPSEPLHLSLAIFEPLIGSSPVSTEPSPAYTVYDNRGFSSYSRVVFTLLCVCLDDWRLARENMWVLRHLIALQLYAADFLRLPTLRSPVFGSQAVKPALTELLDKVRQLTTYVLASSVEDGWHAKVVAAALQRQSPGKLGSLGEFVVDLISRSVASDSIREFRILRVVLQRILRNTNKDEADQWVLLARKIEKKGESFLSPVMCTLKFFLTLVLPSPSNVDGYHFFGGRFCAGPAWPRPVSE
jgi:hypothetical protein